MLTRLLGLLLRARSKRYAMTLRLGPTGPVRHTRQHPPRPQSTRPMRASRAHNSGDTHNAIQYRAVRDAHDRIHTGLTRTRSRQRAQRPANGHPEAAGSRTHTRERTRSWLVARRRLRRPRRSATCGPLARRPGRTACRSRGTWVRGETQRTAPMPTAEGGRRMGGQQWGAHRGLASRVVGSCASQGATVLTLTPACPGASHDNPASFEPSLAI